MSTFFNIRPASVEDAEGIVRAHYSAVHETAVKDYAAPVLAAWSRPVSARRITAHRTKMQTEKAIVSYVAVDDSNKVLGFGELVPPETLGAIYVAASAGRRGVGSALIKTLEAKARELGMKMLRMESSLTAVPFYVRHGFHELERGEHHMADGVLMACVKMEKAL
jgi:putative acetyltransferase